MSGSSPGSRSSSSRNSTPIHMAAITPPIGTNPTVLRKVVAVLAQLNDEGAPMGAPSSLSCARTATTLRSTVGFVPIGGVIAAMWMGVLFLDDDDREPGELPDMHVLLAYQSAHI